MFIGEYWTVDILGSLFAALLGFSIVYFSWERIEPLWSNGPNLYEDIEGKLFSRRLERKER